jgi:hypothetical protein
MKKLFFAALAGIFLTACSTGSDKTASSDATAPNTKDTVNYLYRAGYSSDITVPGNPENARKVLQVWKYFETDQIEAMKPYFADSVRYDDANGLHFFGKTADLLAFAAKDYSSLDSMRFDISMWQSSHINDRNEDWVNIWSSERRYGKNGKADTILMQENWRVKDGKIIQFNQYTARK